MKMKTKIFITAVITALFTCGITTWCCLGLIYPIQRSDTASKLSLIDSLLEGTYLYDYDKELAGEYALMAYVAALDEPYTQYYPADMFSSYQNAITEGYTGIGITVSVNKDNKIEIISVAEDSPAMDAGIIEGDLLTAIEGTQYDGSQLTEAVGVIKGGAIGSSVNVTVLRNDTEEINMTIERRDIISHSVEGKMLDDGIGYISISSFNAPSSTGNSTSSEFTAALKELSDSGMEKLIIDLRDNPGGVLSEVCAIADTILPEGLITYTEDKHGVRKEYVSDKECINLPMVVLINGNSASAAEVLTGALKDHDHATVVGETSFGKGIVQNVLTLFDGSGLALTSAKYYTPNGECIHEIGIEPDILIETDETKGSADVQLQKAIEIIKEK